MKSLRNLVIKSLYDNAGNDDRLIRELNDLAETYGSQIYPIIFHVLTHLYLDVDKARYCWQNIVKHREALSQRLDREVNLRTAICDYFCSIEKSLKNPKVVEIHIFESKDHSAKYDFLTGLYSRGAFEGSLAREISRSRRHETETSLLFLDIDDFKRVNDTYGHPAGDEVLRNIARIILEETRSEDIAARYGGEEIVVVLPETGKAKAMLVGERIRERVEQMRVEYGDGAIRVTVSGGIASYPIDSENARDLVRYADEALYRAKSYGKNTVVLYSPDKRRYFRIDFRTDIEIRKIGYNDDIKTIHAKSKNISMSGILIESRFPLDIGAKVEMRISFNTHDMPLLLIGTVVRVEVYQRDHYDIGLSFIEMDRTTKNEISRYLIRQLVNEKQLVD